MAPFNLFADQYQAAGFLVVVIFTPITTLAVALRFLSSRTSTGKVGVEDWLALGALLAFYGWVTCICIGLSYANGHDLTTMSLDEIAGTLKMIWATGFFYGPNQLCAKLSILFLYHRIFGVNIVYARWIKFLGLIQILLTPVNIFINAFQCNPVHKYWDVLEMNGSCLPVGPYLAAVETINSSVDFAMVILAMAMLRELQVGKTHRWKLAAIFIAGGIAGLIGFIKIGLAFNVNVHNQVFLGLWSTVQSAVSVLCCCVITYRPLFGPLGPFSRLASALSGTFNRGTTKSSGSRTGERSDGWLDLDGSGRGRGLVSTVIDGPGGTTRGTSSEGSTGKEQEGEHDDVGYQLKTVKVQQRVEYV